MLSLSCQIGGWLKLWRWRDRSKENSCGCVVKQIAAEVQRCQIKRQLLENWLSNQRLTTARVNFTYNLCEAFSFFTFSHISDVLFRLFLQIKNLCPSFFWLPDTQLIQQSFEATRKNQAGCQTCVALTPLPSGIPVEFGPTTFRSWAVFATN